MCIGIGSQLCRVLPGIPTNLELDEYLRVKTNLAAVLGKALVDRGGRLNKGSGFFLDCSSGDKPEFRHPHVEYEWVVQEDAEGEAMVSCFPSNA